MEKINNDIHSYKNNFLELSKETIEEYDMQMSLMTEQMAPSWTVDVHISHVSGLGDNESQLFRSIRNHFNHLFFIILGIVLFCLQICQVCFDC